MTISARGPYEEPESSTTKWVTLFVLLSLLAHAVIIALILLVTRFMPVPKLALPDATSPTVSLSLEPPFPSQPKKPIFIPTTPEANVKHQDQLVESANDHDLTSKNRTARAPDSILPDVTGKEKKSDLNDSPLVQAPPTPKAATTPPQPKQATPHQPTPPQPKPDRGQQVSTQPPQPKSKPLPPTPPQKTPPQYDVNGFPVLPPLNVPTMAPPNSAPQPLAPAASMQQQAGSIHGALGRSGDNSPAAMATELGKYKQYVYSVVGSHWYPAIDQHFGIIGVGIVRIRFTIHSDGTLSDVVVTEGDNQQILRDISRLSLIAPAPYKSFSAAMIKEVGDSYTDEFTFQEY